MKGSTPVVYWHRELPPRDANPIGKHTIEATSDRVPGKFVRRDVAWDRGYRQLMERIDGRMEQEIDRLGGDYAHVLGETIEPRHDDSTGEAWMYGRFDYELYRRDARDSNRWRQLPGGSSCENALVPFSSSHDAERRPAGNCFTN